MKKKFICIGSFFLLLFNVSLASVSADQLETEVVVEFQNEYIPSAIAAPHQKAKNPTVNEEPAQIDGAGLQSKADAKKNTQSKIAQAYLPKTNERFSNHWLLYGFILIGMGLILLKKRSAQYEK